MKMSGRSDRSTKPYPASGRRLLAPQDMSHQDVIKLKASNRLDWPFLHSTKHSTLLIPAPLLNLSLSLFLPLYLLLLHIGFFFLSLTLSASLSLKCVLASFSLFCFSFLSLSFLVPLFYFCSFIPPSLFSLVFFLYCFFLSMSALPTLDISITVKTSFKPIRTHWILKPSH